MALLVLDGPVIEAGESLSEGLDCRAGKLIRITMPPVWSPANLTFQLSTDGARYGDLVDTEGREVMIPVRAASTIVIAPSSPFVAAIQFIKFRSGPRSYPIPQDDRRDFELTIESNDAADGGPAPPASGSLPAFKFNTIAGQDGSTFDVDVIAGANEVIVMLTGSGAASIATPSAADIIAAAALAVDDSYRFRLCNPSSGAVTLVRGTAVTITGLDVTAANKWREYLVRCIADGAIDFRDVGSGNE